MHLQVIKYAGQLERVSGKEFCEKLGLGAAWGTEFVIPAAGGWPRRC